MNAAIFSPAEYRQLGNQLASFHPHCCKLNVLLSWAYPVRHPLRQACYSATEDGLFAFRCHMETMARLDHPEIDWHYSFFPNGQEDHNQPLTLPGRTDVEARQLAESLQHRRLKKNKEPLTTQELAIAVRCYRHINETVAAIMDRFEAGGRGPGTILIELSISVQIVSNALILLQREEQRVAHE